MLQLTFIYVSASNLLETTYSSKVLKPIIMLLIFKIFQ